MATTGPKNIGRINRVAVLTRVLLQENVWWFLTGSQKSGRNNKVAVRQGSTVTCNIILGSATPLNSFIFVLLRIEYTSHIFQSMQKLR